MIATSLLTDLAPTSRNTALTEAGQSVAQSLAQPAQSLTESAAPETTQSVAQPVAQSLTDTPEHPSENPSENPQAPVVHYKRVDVGTLRFMPMEKVDNMYVVPLATPLRVQTPPVLLVGDIHSTTIRLVGRGSFKRFAQSVEQAILKAAIDHKAEWFRKPITDETLTKGFKSFVSGKGFKVKLDDDLMAFDSEGDIMDFDDFDTPVSARCIIELDGVCFGRKEFGAMWNLAQLQIARLPQCIISSPKAAPALVATRTASEFA